MSTTKPDPIETAIAEGARRAFAKRAATLRQEAASMSTTETDSADRTVPIVPPEARVKARTADVLDECAADVSTATVADRIPALYAEKIRVTGLLNGGHYATEEEADALMDVWGACDKAAIETPALTTAGAIASIEWARGELLDFGFAVDPVAGDRGVRIVLALLDGAIAALRQEGGAA